MDKQELTQAELDFQTVTGTLFSLSTTVEYLIASGAMFRERKANYIANKCRDAEKSCQLLYDRLLNEILRRLSDDERKIFLDGIENHKETIYSFFLLDTKDMERVKGLVNKIRKDKLS